MSQAFEHPAPQEGQDPVVLEFGHRQYSLLDRAVRHRTGESFQDIVAGGDSERVFSALELGLKPAIQFDGALKHGGEIIASRHGVSPDNSQFAGSPAKQASASAALLRKKAEEAGTIEFFVTSRSLPGKTPQIKKIGTLALRPDSLAA